MTVKISGNSSSSTPSFAGDDGDSGLHATADQVQLVTNGTVGVTVNSSQNVGIGTTSPAPNVGNGTTLHLSGATTTTELRLTRGNGTDVSITAGSSGGGCGIQSSTFVAFSTNGANERARFLSTGGLTFNGDTAVANALDDYEEGTFTPSLAGASTAGTFTAGAANGGIYTKIGNIVHCQMNVDGNLAGAAGQPRVHGMPFTSASNTTGANATYSTGSLQYWDGSGANFMGPLSLPSSTTIFFHSYDGDSSGSANVANGNHNLHCTVTYRVT